MMPRPTAPSTTPGTARPILAPWQPFGINIEYWCPNPVCPNDRVCRACWNPNYAVRDEIEEIERQGFVECVGVG
jgi:hypothetical protein